MREILEKALYRLKRPYHWVKTGLLRGLAGQIRAGFPAKKLKIITVTGTDGKTTTSTLIHHILTSTGKKAGLISTVAAYIGDEEIETGLHVTSPDPLQLHLLLKKMVKAEMEYVVLEVTSHGAYQFRIWGIVPFMTGLTNVAREHLDYHLNYDEYLRAKSLVLRSAKDVVLNSDDESFGPMRALLPQDEEHILTYDLEKSIPHEVDKAIQQRFPEKYNWLNARLAYTITRELDLQPQEIATAIESFPGVPGRMQEVKTNKKFRVVVDFAHTPQAVEAALTALKSQLKSKSNRLIAVYGSAGLRDHQKRPTMGQVGAHLADLIVFTAEDPRSEDVWSIIRQLKENLSEELSKVMSVADRREAIEFALTELAKPGDIVAILGKGHEKSMCYGKTEYPWSDVGVVEETLAKL